MQGPLNTNIHWRCIFNDTWVKLLWTNLTLFPLAGSHCFMVNAYIWWLRWDINLLSSVSTVYLAPNRSLVVEMLHQLSVDKRNMNLNILSSTLSAYWSRQRCLRFVITGRFKWRQFGPMNYSDAKIPLHLSPPDHPALNDSEHSVEDIDFFDYPVWTMFIFGGDILPKTCKRTPKSLYQDAMNFSCAWEDFPSYMQTISF